MTVREGTLGGALYLLGSMQLGDYIEPPFSLRHLLPTRYRRWMKPKEPTRRRTLIIDVIRTYASIVFFLIIALVPAN